MTTCVYCGKEIELLGGMWFASPTGSACYENRHSGHKPAQADALKMTCPHDEQQCESPRCLGDDPAYSDRRCKAAQAKAAAQPQSMLPAETSGFEHAVDELAQKIIDENKGTSMSAAYRQVAKDLYLAFHSAGGEAVANEPWLKIEFTRKNMASSGLLHSACGGATWESDQLKGIQRLKITRLKNDVFAGTISQLRVSLNAALERERILLEQLPTKVGPIE